MSYEYEQPEEFEVSPVETLIVIVLLSAFIGSILGGIIKLATARDVSGYNFDKVKPAFMEKKMALTKKQRDVLDFIKTYKFKNRVSPTQREILEHFKFKSLGSVQDYLNYLERNGSIIVNKSHARGITLRDECPACGGFQ